MKIAFIGAGNVARNLAPYFATCHTLHGFYDHNYEKAEECAKHYASNAYTSLKELLLADMIFITVQDNHIETVAKEIESYLETRKDDKKETNFIESIKEKWFLHTSGAHNVDVLMALSPYTKKLGSIHPLQSFTSNAEPKSLSTTHFTIENTPFAEELITFITSLHNPYSIIPSDKKPLYHASACVMSNYLTTLMEYGYTLAKASGIDEKEIFPAFFPLIEGTLHNIEQLGPQKALTGPLSRGDTKTINTHLEAMKSYHIPSATYIELARKTLEMEPTHKETKKEMYDILTSYEKL